MSTQKRMEQVTPDMEKILSYIQTYGHCDGRNGIENILAPWSKNKSMLWKLLGKKLSTSIEVSLQKTDKDMTRELRHIYDIDELNTEVRTGINQLNPFVRKYIRYVTTTLKGLIDDIALDNITMGLFYAPTMIDNTTEFHRNSFTVEYEGTKVTFQHGMKPMRAINKVIRLLGKENFPDYEEFRLAHSNLFTTKEIKGILTFSLHPLDYMTMSDNANGWSTCMSWIRDECYRLGTLEMVNSNNVLCCYLQSKDPMTWKKETQTWNNKSWRILAYINKDIILTGKSYPYDNDALAQIVVRELTILAKENLNWTYGYDVQPYRDMIHIWDNKMANNEHDRRPNKKSILFKGMFMYNDLIKDNDSTYWCVRNKVKKQKVISYSGQAYCLDCGKPFSYKLGEDGSNMFVCEECRKRYACHECGDYIHEGTGRIINGKLYCKHCFKYMHKCPDCGELYRYGENYLILNDEEELTRIEAGNFKTSYYWPQLKDNINAQRVVTCSSCYQKMVNAGDLPRLYPGSSFRYYIIPCDRKDKYIQERLEEDTYKWQIDYSTNNMMDSYSNLVGAYTSLEGVTTLTSEAVTTFISSMTG